MANLHMCDGCKKMRRGVVSVGRDANGDPDSPDLCWPCRSKKPTTAAIEVGEMTEMPVPTDLWADDESF